MTEPNTDTAALIKSMRRSVAKTLEQKRRLGRYAVVWEDGKVVRLQADEISPRAVAEDQ